MKQIIVEIFSPKSRVWAGVAGLMILAGYKKLITDTPSDDLIIGSILTLSGFIIFRQIFCTVMIVGGSEDYNLRQDSKRYRFFSQGLFSRIMGGVMEDDDGYLVPTNIQDHGDFEIEEGNDEGNLGGDIRDYSKDPVSHEGRFYKLHQGVGSSLSLAGAGLTSVGRRSKNLAGSTLDLVGRGTGATFTHLGSGLYKIGQGTKNLAGSTLDLVGRGTGATFTHLGSGLYKIGKGTRDLTGSTLSLFGKGTGATLNHLGSGIYRIGQRTRNLTGSTLTLLGFGSSNIANGLMAFSWGIARAGRKGGYAMLTAQQAMLYNTLVFMQQHGYILVMVALMASGFLDLAGADAFKTARVFFIVSMINKIAEEFRKRDSLHSKIAIEVLAHIPAQ